MINYFTFKLSIEKINGNIHYGWDLMSYMDFLGAYLLIVLDTLCTYIKQLMMK